jgi:PIN domain nuclease of toxin-antitoxin system
VILIDTHVIVWVTEGSASVGKRARATIEQALAVREALVSAASFWEVGMLLSKGRIALSLPLSEWADAVDRRAGFKIVTVDAPIAVEAGSLPEGIHGDPNDRFIVATARVLGIPILTADSKILDYAKLGHVGAIDAQL